MAVPAIADAIDQTVAVLRRGGVVAFPTDTLYALGADAGADAAVARVYAVKGREGGRPLPLFVDGLETAERVALLNDAARRLAARFWPGALTLVLPRRPPFHSLALAGGDTVALRVPDHAIALAVVRGLGRPVTGTSANRSGGKDPLTAADVEEQIGGEIDFLLDGGPCDLGSPSSIVECVGAAARILRAGAIDEDAIKQVTHA